MVKLDKERRAGNRGAGGRPRQDGERYENGRRKPDNGPNAAIMAQRHAMGLTSTQQAFTPLGVATVHKWLGEAEVRTAQAFATMHRASKLLGPRLPAQGDLSNPEAVDVRAVNWSQLSDAEISAIWESALRDVRPELVDGGEALAAEAMIRWKAACAVMTPDERREVVRFCIDDSWPQWILQRRAGRMATTWERQRDLLISGLRAIASASARPRPVRCVDELTDKPRRAPGRAVVERTVYVDEEQNTVLQVERVTRRAA